MQNKTPIRFSNREAEPLVGKNGKNDHVLMCPFCKPSHPLSLTETPACGTTIQVRAVQPVIKAHRYPGLVCVKCRKGGGRMVPWQKGYIHDHDCTPGRVTLTQLPEPSGLAKWVHGLKPGRVKTWFTKKYGVASPIEEVLPDGKMTGVITGYFFYKGPPNVARTPEQREHTPAQAGK